MNELFLVGAKAQIGLAGGFPGLPFGFACGNDAQFAGAEALQGFFHGVRYIRRLAERLCHGRYQLRPVYCLQGFPQCSGFLPVSHVAPLAKEASGVGEGTRQAQGGVGGDREYIFVFQQHHTFQCQLPRQFQMLFASAEALFLLFVRVLAGIFKKPQTVFQLQNTYDTSVDFFLGNAALLQQVLKGCSVYAGHHLDIHSRMEALFPGFQGIGGHGMVHQFFHRRIVGDYHPLKIPFPAQNPVKQQTAAGGGNPFHRIEGGHHHGSACLNGFPVGREIEIPQHAPGHVYGIVVASALRLSIGCKMLHAGCDFPFFSRIFSLVAPDGGSRHLPV